MRSFFIHSSLLFSFKMNDSLLFFSSSMSRDHQRIQEIKHHINQLLAELQLMQAKECRPPFYLSINSELTSVSQKKTRLDYPCCPCLSPKSDQQMRLHSTTLSENQKVQRKKINKKLLFTPNSPKKLFLTARATSTPKSSPLPTTALARYHTSTPRRSKRHLIPLKRLLYNHDYPRYRPSAALPFARHTPLHPIVENHQWIWMLRCCRFYNQINRNASLNVYRTYSFTSNSSSFVFNHDDHVWCGSLEKKLFRKHDNCSLRDNSLSL